MKSWLAKFRISTALDANSSATPGAHAPGGEGSGLQQFHDDLRDLHMQLPRAPRVQVPPDLHAGIMAAVRRASPKAPEPLWLRLFSTAWAPALGVGVLALFLVAAAAFRFWRNPTILGAPSPVIGEQVARLPTQALSPLTKEWDHLDQDLRAAADFVLASVP